MKTIALAWLTRLLGPEWLALRIALGAAALGALAWVDWRRHGPNAQRWREYVFLLACVAAAMLYGAINDQVTVSLSWEYFYFGKELQPALGPLATPDGPPPPAGPLRWEAAKVGLKATWWTGLLFGVAILMANNPRRSLPALPRRRLYRAIPLVFLLAAGCGAALGVAGYLGALVGWHGDFPLMLREDFWRPRRFMAVYGVHTGGYLGGLLGALLAVAWVVRARRRVPATGDPATAPPVA